MYQQQQKITLRFVIVATSLALAMLGMVYLHGLAVKNRHPDVSKHQVDDPTTVLAVVNSDVINRSDLSALSPPLPADQALGLMVDFTLLDQAAAKKHVVVSDADMQEVRQDTVEAQGVTSYAEAASKLGRSQLSLDLQLRHVVLLQKLAALELALPPHGMYHARGILIKTAGKDAKSSAEARSFAMQLQKQITAGADIASLARRYSDDPLSGPTGGNLGVIQLAGAANLVKVSEDFPLQVDLAGAVPSAKPNEVLPGPIDGALGYWVVESMSTDSRPGSDSLLYANIKSEWRSLWLSRLEPGVIARLRSAASIQPPLQQPAQSRPS